MTASLQDEYTNYQYATYYCGLGLTVLPAKGKICSKKWGKFKDNPPNQELIASWFRQGKANVMLMCGGKHGLMVRDFDTVESYQAWAEAHREVAEMLPTVVTRRGFHVYAAITEDHEAEVRQHFKSDGDGCIDLADGELRIGEGSLVVAPPSVHPERDENGHDVVYHWKIPLDNENLYEISVFDHDLHLNWHPFTQTDRRTDGHDTHDNHDTHDVSQVSIFSKSKLENFCLDDVWADIMPIVEKTLPTRSGQRNAKLFELARCLKFHPALLGATPKQLKPIVRKWFEMALPCIATKDFMTTFTDFTRQHRKAKVPLDASPKIIAATMLLDPLPPNLDPEYHDTVEPMRGLALCREMQMMAGDEPFFIGCRDMGEALGCSHTHAAKLLTLYEGDGFLTVVKRYKAKERKATEYRYNGPLE